MKRWNLSDRFLVVFAILCICAVGLRAWGLKADRTGGPAQIELQGEWSDVEVRTADCLEEGDLLYTAAGELFGRVTRVERTAAEAELDVGGNRIELPYPMDTRVDLRVTVQLTGRVEGGTFLREGGAPLAVGERMTLYSRACEISFRVLLCDVIA